MCDEAYRDVRVLFDGEGVEEGHEIAEEVVQDLCWDVRDSFLEEDVKDGFGDASRSISVILPPPWEGNC